ncbi:MAG: AAA family ATPase [Methanosarcinales archaeon]
MINESDLNSVWIEKYRPKTLDEIIGHKEIINNLKHLIKSNNLPHLVLYGPKNTGKTSTAFAIARELYRDSWKSDFTYFNASDFFKGGKKYIAENKQFMPFIKTDDPKKIQKSVIDIFKAVIKEYAGIAPLNADYRIIFIDSAESLPHGKQGQDAQQALRRIMERYNRTCRFIFSTTQLSKLIPPIRSRCLNLFFSPLLDQKKYIKYIADKENINITEEGIDAIQYYAKGDLAKAINTLQIATTLESKISEETIFEIVSMESPEEKKIKELINATFNNKFIDAIKLIDTLLQKYGLSGSEILKLFHDTILKKYPDQLAKYIKYIADADYNLTKGSKERIQLEHLLLRCMLD